MRINTFSCNSVQTVRNIHPVSSKNTTRHTSHLIFTYGRHRSFTLNTLSIFSDHTRERHTTSAHIWRLCSFPVTRGDDTRHEKWWENCGEASSRLIPPSPHSFLVSLLLSTKVGARCSQGTALACLILGALWEGDHFWGPTRKSAVRPRR